MQQKEKQSKTPLKQGSFTQRQTPFSFCHWSCTMSHSAMGVEVAETDCDCIKVEWPLPPKTDVQKRHLHHPTWGFLKRHFMLWNLYSSLGRFAKKLMWCPQWVSKGFLPFNLISGHLCECITQTSRLSVLLFALNVWSSKQKSSCKSNSAPALPIGTSPPSPSHTWIGKVIFFLSAYSQTFSTLTS